MLTPIAYLLTWTTYGTWLHGDERGSYDRKAKSRRSKFLPPDIRFEALRRSQLKHPPLLIEPPMRRVVRVAIEGDCDYRNWHLYALNVRTNHVHAVLGYHADPSRMLQTLKGRATRKLREAGLVDPDRPVWTPSGSKTWLLDEDELRDAIVYVLHRQGPDLPGGLTSARHWHAGLTCCLHLLTGRVMVITQGVFCMGAVA